MAPPLVAMTRTGGLGVNSIEQIMVKVLLENWLQIELGFCNKIPIDEHYVCLLRHNSIGFSSHNSSI